MPVSALTGDGSLPGLQVAASSSVLWQRRAWDSSLSPLLIQTLIPSRPPPHDLI